MTFNGWKTIYSHQLDLMDYSELQQLPEWNDWIKRVDDVFNEMDYEDAIGCEFEDLIGLAGLTDEIEAAKAKLAKDSVVNKRMKNLQSDF